MPVSSPGVSVIVADVEFPIVVLGETLRTGDDHGADRVRAHHVAVVVDLDSARRRGKPEDLGEAGEEPRLARRVGQLARERFARIGDCVLDQLALLAALRHGDLDLVSSLFAERRLQQLALLEIGGDEDQPRHRLVVVELREERLRAPRAPRGSCRPAGNRRGFPSSVRCGRRRPGSQVMPPA